MKAWAVLHIGILAADLWGHTGMRFDWLLLTAMRCRVWLDVHT